ncbi:MAG: DoxX family protein [Dyadobacter sp.]|uniref:DoxX family protein n=1 Tax=Dyadobacter sp. TaxID=1914288 RepID=UPI001B056323|nr:DoxX family protein [Dyadobacter sp.]MBO9611763.1 DoxX family protein [Dyadobacter sp.]
MSIRKLSKWQHIALWLMQVLLAATLVWAAGMKLFQPAEALLAMWPWTGQVSPVLVKLTGMADLLAGIGLVLPSLTNIRPALTFVAAVGVVLLMVCAMVFHLSRGESPVFNIVFGMFAAWVAWGRRPAAASLC